MDMLDADTTTLTALLLVNRLFFFLTVPRFYRHPFQRVDNLYQRQSHLT
jgi:hypothetical protein